MMISNQVAAVVSLLLLYSHGSILLHQNLCLEKASKVSWIWKVSGGRNPEKEEEERCHFLLQHDHLAGGGHLHISGGLNRELQ